MNPDKHLKGYPTLDEACDAALEYAQANTQWHQIVPIYQESDESFSVKNERDDSSLFFMGIDKTGKKYKLVNKVNRDGVPYKVYEEIKG